MFYGCFIVVSIKFLPSSHAVSSQHLYCQPVAKCQKNATMLQMGHQQDAEKLDAEERCIVCGEPSKVRRRGLCPKHHMRFVRARQQLAASEQESFEAMLIEQGQLLPNRRGQKLGEGEDEFAEALKAFLALKAGGEVPDGALEDAAEAVADAEAIAAAAAAAKKQRKPAAKPHQTKK